jgi:hypothetical protein
MQWVKTLRFKIHRHILSISKKDELSQQWNECITLGLHIYKNGDESDRSFY